jgi:hypothetical protein
MITILNALVPVLLALTSPTPTPTAAPAAAATNCWCQSIPLKDWGK